MSKLILIVAALVTLAGIIVFSEREWSTYLTLSQEGPRVAQPQKFKTTGGREMRPDWDDEASQEDDASRK